MSKIRVIKARKILTMDAEKPYATHVAICDGKILAVGDESCTHDLGEFETTEQFENSVLIPGFVEGHAHVMAGAVWQYIYIGYHDRTDPTGKFWRGLTDIDEVLERVRLAEANLEPETPLICWGFDPIFFESDRLSRQHLDTISKKRPIAVMYSNFHVLCANSIALQAVEIDEDIEIEGVRKDAAGQPTGELQEIAAMYPVMRRLGIDDRSMVQSELAFRNYGEVAKRAGVTTITDLFASFENEDIALMTRITGERDFPVRIVSVLGAQGGTPDEIARHAKKIKTYSTDRLLLGSIKLMTDGSIQSWTARVKDPGYVNGKPNGIWNMAPEQIFALCEVLHRENVQMHIHVNGDEASEICIDALETAMKTHPREDMRHVLQHCQLMESDQYARCGELGICANIFINHLWYFGDQHASFTVGVDRAQRMDDCRAALDAGVKIAVHSDAPVTPLDPLFSMWCAVTRQTMKGTTLGKERRLTAQEALHAVTLGPAYSLHLDDEIGSIEVGKNADFAVLDQDPIDVDPDDLKDIRVIGTIFGGQAHIV